MPCLGGFSFEIRAPFVRFELLELHPRQPLAFAARLAIPWWPGLISPWEFLGSRDYGIPGGVLWRSSFALLACE